MRSCQSGCRCRSSSSMAADVAEQLGPLHLLGGRVDGDVRLVVVVEEGEHAVILLLRQRIVLVVVALGALDGQAEDALADGVHAVEHRLHAELLRIDAAFLVDHRVAEKAGGHDLVLRRAGQQVAGDLVDDELIVGQVAIEGVDDPIAVEPDEPRLVLFVAVGVGVARGVEPDAGPSVRRSAARPAGVRPASRRPARLLSARKASTSAMVGGRPIRSRLRRRSSVTRSASADGVSPFCFQPGQHEAIERVAHPLRILHDRKRRTHRRPERPVVFPAPRRRPARRARPLPPRSTRAAA